MALVAAVPGLAALVGAVLSSGSAAALPLPASATCPTGSQRAAEAAAALAAGEVTPGPVPRLRGVRAITGHEPHAAGYVAFTFDDGPNLPTTPKILAALAKHHVPAAFFVCGYQLEGDSAFKRGNRRTLDALIAAGHLVGNHTYGHSRLVSADLPVAAAALGRAETLIAPHLGRRTALFRPPYGKVSAAARRLLDDLGYATVGWNIDPDDSRPRTPEEVRDRVLAQLRERGGGIVILHDTKGWTAKAVPMILAELERDNCRRLARGRAPILPVSLDYFATDASGAPRPIPPEVAAQTARTRAALEKRCAPRKPRVRTTALTPAATEVSPGNRLD